MARRKDFELGSPDVISAQSYSTVFVLFLTAAQCDMKLGHEGHKHYTNRMQVLQPDGYGDMFTVTLQWGAQGGPSGSGGVHD